MPEGAGEGGSSFFRKARQKGSRWLRVRLPAEVSTNDTKRPAGTVPPGVDPADLAVAPTHRPWVQFSVTDKIRPGSIHSFRIRCVAIVCGMWAVVGAVGAVGAVGLWACILLSHAVLG
jgi:hypothetical protein